MKENEIREMGYRLGFEFSSKEEELFWESFLAGSAARKTKEQVTALVQENWIALQKELGRKPTVLELAERCGIDSIAVKYNFGEKQCFKETME